jgi:hypothetical protein
LLRNFLTSSCSILLSLFHKLITVPILWIQSDDLKNVFSWFLMQLSEEFTNWNNEFLKNLIWIFVHYLKGFVKSCEVSFKIFLIKIFIYKTNFRLVQISQEFLLFLKNKEINWNHHFGWMKRRINKFMHDFHIFQSNIWIDFKISLLFREYFLPKKQNMWWK